MEGSSRLASKLAALAAMGFEPVHSPRVSTESLPVGRGRYRVASSRPSMGTLVSITVIHTSVDGAEEAMGRAYEGMDRVVKLLNRYDSSSALSYLNLEGAIGRPPPELAHVVSKALQYHRLSAGAFDITVQPLVDLLRGSCSHLGSTPPPPSLRDSSSSSSSARGPTDHEVREALGRVGSEAVRFGRASIRFEKPGMGVTLDGIAKGHVVDVMAHILTTEGLADFLVNAGGDIRVSGCREDGKPWQVAVQDPQKGGTFPQVFPLHQGAVATSGSYEIFFDGERTRHHIVSGLTGSSPRPCSSVTVTAPTALAADALATAVFVMGPERGRVFINQLPECACLIIDEANRQLVSDRWRNAAAHP
jgi:thiamine biosynthesis lipoprotein